MTDSGSFWFLLKFIFLFFSPSILIFDIILIYYFVEFKGVCVCVFLLNEQNFFLQEYFVIVMKTITKWERLFLKWLIDRYWLE